jgi:hypothetical protein
MHQITVPTWFLLLGLYNIITGLCDALFWGPQPMTPLRSLVSGLVMVVLSGVGVLCRMGWQWMRHGRHMRHAGL